MSRRPPPPLSAKLAEERADIGRDGIGPLHRDEMVAAGLSWGHWMSVVWRSAGQRIPGDPLYTPVGAVLSPHGQAKPVLS
jgi:hypothetical protein